MTENSVVNSVFTKLLSDKGPLTSSHNNIFAFCSFANPHFQSDSYTAKSKLCQQKQPKDIASAQDEVLEYLLFLSFYPGIRGPLRNN